MSIVPVVVAVIVTIGMKMILVAVLALIVVERSVIMRMARQVLNGESDRDSKQKGCSQFASVVVVERHFRQQVRQRESDKESRGNG